MSPIAIREIPRIFAPHCNKTVALLRHKPLANAGLDAWGIQTLQSQ
jgi:hypothetical protein